MYIIYIYVYISTRKISASYVRSVACAAAPNKIRVAHVKRGRSREFSCLPCSASYLPELFLWYESHTHL